MSYSIKVDDENVIKFSSSDRGPCDDYCPLVSVMCCGLPDAPDVYQAAKKKGLVWACHSNKTVPCVATGYNRFPQGCTVITETEDFIKLTGYLC